MDELDFLRKCEEIHGARYVYSSVEYKNLTTKIKILCSLHGIFEQTPRIHLKSGGCPKCRNRKTQENFVLESNRIHQNKYDYSLVVYRNTKSKVIIICPEHGKFEQIADHHVRGMGCPSCSGLKRKTTEDFIKISKDIHDDRYDYSKTNYINNRTNVEIICPLHGIFHQLPKHHLNGSGCSKCSNKSKGEKVIKKILKEKNINFEIQKTFNGCSYKSKLQFDFYLPDYNLCIEYDGIQHFKQIDWFGGESGYKETKKRDNIKNNFCKDKQMPLLRIPYNKDIEDILNEYLNGIR